MSSMARAAPGALSALLAGSLAAGCAGAPPAPPRGAAPAVAASDAADGYGGCAAPIRVAAIPPADEAAALALVRDFAERLRGPDGAPVRARRIGLGACDGQTAPEFAVLDFWLIGARTVVFAPFAPGAPEPPPGLSLLAS
jgi:hypothetical protein